MLLHVLIAIGVIAAAIGLAALLHRGQRAEEVGETEKPDYRTVGRWARMIAEAA